MSACRTIPTVREMHEEASRLSKQGKRIGVVPTMGALHEGHLSLVQASRKEADITIATIFVNPTQFSANEDLSKYPRTIDQDISMLSELGVDFVFLPTESEMYPPGFSTYVEPPKVAGLLEGEHRPTHFRGVTTVVTKLLLLTRADVAFFGQKDYQQSLVIRKMVEDLNIPTDIRVCPIVRDVDGLALSSRNVYLSPEERKIALSISQTLNELREKVEQGGERDGAALETWMLSCLRERGIANIDYALVADANTLERQKLLGLPAVALIAAFVGNTRLIDNVVIGETNR